MAQKKLIVVFVHGWSVSNTDTYGELPIRLAAEAKASGIEIRVKEIFLGRYISFHDEVRVNDISRAFQTAVKDELSTLLAEGNRFVCITHSTGGPVIRDWWHRYYEADTEFGVCPMSHLIMLAPANYGSALGQLGKERLGRIKSWFEGVEPGQGVLDWLELGSEESWKLNVNWIHSGGSSIGGDGVFPFVITGQYIDRAFYDNLNTYTGELGSDGVVRSAAANLCGRHIELCQEFPVKEKGRFKARKLEVKSFTEAPDTAFRIVSNTSHSGKKMGIMRSVKKNLNSRKSKETVSAILRCLQVKTKKEYGKLCKKFMKETESVQDKEFLEVEDHFLISDTRFYHDKFSMVIFRIRDDEGCPVTDFDLILTAGPENDANHLPKGFFADRQRNSINPEIITYYLNYNVMIGFDEVKDKDGDTVRKKLPGAESLGIKITARPEDGFVRYLPCSISASKDLLLKALQVNGTTLIDIQLKRIVSDNVFRMKKMTKKTKPVDFKYDIPGRGIAD